MSASEEQLARLRLNPSRVFNVCILAHVDHGKTSLADSVVATAGLLPSRMAGSLRFLDYRPDEQERGITLKSSGVTISHGDSLVNLIDSPGHVDFAGEVSTAVRLCDGAIVVVDVVEGVCAQTLAALRAARLERLRPLLVLNKLDRLSLELHLTPIDAYGRLVQLLEQLNAIMASDAALEEAMNEEEEDDEIANMEENGSIEGADDYFVPAKGNVVFASALDAWGFRTEFFARLYSKRLGVPVEELLAGLWGDFYISGKPAEIRSGAAAKARKPLFVTLILDNLWSLYDTICVRRDKEKLSHIIETLGLKVTARDMRQTDSRALTKTVLSQWLHLGITVLDAVCDQLPSAADISEEKVENLMTSVNWTLETCPTATKELKKHFLACSPVDKAPTIAFVSKMFPVPRQALPQNRIRTPMLTSNTLAAKRAAVRQARIDFLSKADDNQETKCDDTVVTVTKPLDRCSEIKECDETVKCQEVSGKTAEEEEVFVALARVYSGILKPGQTIYVLGPKHDPRQPVAIEDIENLTLADLKANQHVTKAVIGEVYTLLGRELGICKEAPAGSVIGVGGLAEHVLKSATLSTELACPPFCALRSLTFPILRVAVEPARPADLPTLLHGLRLLNQADACVQVLVQESGELVLMTAGELHLERCLRDLREQFARVDINVSEPIIPFRETIVPPPKVDMANEVIEGEIPVSVNNTECSDVVDGIVTVTTSDKQSAISICAEPLPGEVTLVLEKNGELLRALAFAAEAGVPVDKELADRVNSLHNDLTRLWNGEQVEQILCFGPRRSGPNILLACGGALLGTNIWSPHRTNNLVHLERSVMAGFDAAVAAGPLCEEPMRGVCFIVTDWKIAETEDVTGVRRHLAGQLLSAVRDACRRAFQAQPQRLVAAMFQCQISASPEVVGKVHGVIARRQGRIIKMDAGPAICQISTILPVIESLRVAQELRKATSGLASTQLVFSHWEVLDIDPFWIPHTEEELVQFGDAVLAENRARVYIDSVRRRKGLAIQAQIVQHAEKQRTLKKK